MNSSTRPARPDKKAKNGSNNDNRVIAAVGVYNVVVEALGFYVVMGLWPSGISQLGNSSSVPPTHASLFFMTFRLSYDSALFVIVINTSINVYGVAALSGLHFLEGSIKQAVRFV